MKLKYLIIIFLIYLGRVDAKLLANSQKIWSILICTLEERREKFNFIYNKLQHQIKMLGLEDDIEILYFLDNREHNVGYKRNYLLDSSKGKYICYIDDDDDVHEKYIEMIYQRLLKNPDCVSLVGIITINNQNPKVFIHSIKYDSWFEKDNIYYRPPNHLNPIRAEIAKKFKFPGINHGEDSDWSLQIARSGLIKIEEEITIPYYFYQYGFK